MKRVLIADDEPIERMIVTRTIQKYFPEELAVVSAVNGREAVEQFFAENCQIALLDIEMPGMSGLEAAEQIRERDKNCSIIFLTAFDEFNYARRAIAVRAMEYLLKPVVDQELEAVLAEAIRIADEHTDDREAGEKKEAGHMLEDTENSPNGTVMRTRRIQSAQESGCRRLPGIFRRLLNTIIWTIFRYRQWQRP